MQAEASVLTVLGEIIQASFAEIKFFHLDFFLLLSIERNSYEGFK